MTGECEKLGPLVIVDENVRLTNEMRSDIYGHRNPTVDCRHWCMNYERKENNNDGARVSTN